jgi:chemotaxis regulatin CheY-phosphate phosphatase CheZ
MNEPTPESNCSFQAKGEPPVMEKAEITRLINSFRAIKGYFDTTKKYMPQIAKLVFFIEEIIPLLQTIHSSLHQSTELIPSATEKLGKVTSATEMATTEVMDIVDNVISRLNSMSSNLDIVEENAGKPDAVSSLNEKITEIRNEINGSQDDLFSIMNALQFQDITTQQINSIGSVIESVYGKLSELLQGFDDDGRALGIVKTGTFDPNAEYDFDRSAETQKIVDEILRLRENGVDLNTKDINAIRDLVSKKEQEEEPLDDMIVMGEDGQPKVDMLINRLKSQAEEK